MERKAVVGVDDLADRCPVGREPAECTGFRAVRVDDVVLATHAQLGQPAQRSAVVAR